MRTGESLTGCDGRSEDEDCCRLGSFKLAHAGQALAQVLVRASVLALVLAVLWGVVDWMRSYNTVPLLLPFSEFDTSKQAFGASVQASPPFLWFADLVNFYNIAFPGYCRLGSGMGLIVGSIWALFVIRRDCRAQLFVAGACAGAIVGGRWMLMFSSDAIPFIGATITGAVATASYMVWQQGAKRVPDLPAVDIISQPHASDTGRTDGR